MFICRLLVFGEFRGLVVSVLVFLLAACGSGASLRADFDADGDVGVGDLVVLGEYWLGASVDCFVDVDWNCHADMAEFAALSKQWLCGGIAASASSVENSGLAAVNAVDGDWASRWSSGFSDNQWLELDLGEVRLVNGVEICWEAAYAVAYGVVVSEDGSNWVSVFSTTAGDGGIDNIEFAERSARYVKINCVDRATEYGFSIWEVVVRGDDACLCDEGNVDYVLVWGDEFDGFDSGRWQKATHTWDENLAQFVVENVVFGDGTMKLYLTDEPAGTKDYSGAEYRTIEEFLYGKFEVRMRAAAGSGIVSSFFTFRDPPTEPTWNEIDIEFIGKDTELIQFNHWWGWWPECDPVPFVLSYDASEDFHVYSFEWESGYVRWTVDGVTFYVARENVPWLAQQVMMNIWISNNTTWVGVFNDKVLPVWAEYDYVRYYRKLR